MLKHNINNTFMQVNRHGALRSVGHHAVEAIAKVLNCSQDYMKHTKVNT